MLSKKDDAPLFEAVQKDLAARRGGVSTGMWFDAT
jgi:hypothetical protein